MTYDGNAGTIELVVEGLRGDPEADWLFASPGAGIMVVDPTVFGRASLSTLHDEEDLVFVARSVKLDFQRRHEGALRVSASPRPVDQQLS